MTIVRNISFGLFGMALVGEFVGLGIIHSVVTSNGVGNNDFVVPNTPDRMSLILPWSISVFHLCLIILSLGIIFSGIYEKTKGLMTALYAIASSIIPQTLVLQLNNARLTRLAADFITNTQINPQIRPAPVQLMSRDFLVQASLGYTICGLSLSLAFFSSLLIIAYYSTDYFAQRTWHNDMQTSLPRSKLGNRSV